MATSDNIKIIGGSKNFWIWSERAWARIYAPSHPSVTTSLPSNPIATTKGQAIIDPTKTALVVVDIQNYFLSPLLGRPSRSVGLKVVDTLLKTVIPACRKANIPIVWLGRGIADEDLDDVPPSIVRGFECGLDTNFEDGQPKDLGALGEDMGMLTLEDGTKIAAGRVMMGDAWNTAFYPSLAEAAEPQDMWVCKNRLSGFLGEDKGPAEIEGLLRGRGIRTLLVAGENTDQCVAASMQDAYARGWDTLMLSDACGTNSPEFATKCIEFECENGWGFVLTCRQLVDGIEKMETAP